MRRLMRGINDLATVNPDLAAEWHPTKNNDLTPENIARGANAKVWWQCSLGHEWSARVYTRSRGSGCPYCKGRKVWAGFNDLATLNPILAAEWHPEENMELTPSDVSCRSIKTVWWKCRCGEEWPKKIQSRSDGSRCKVCSSLATNYFGSLAIESPELAKEWNLDKNGDLTPSDVSCVSKKLAWWTCNKGHEWRMSVGRRYYGVGCPVCKKIAREEKARTNTIAFRYPELIKEWHPFKNGSLQPRDVACGSAQKIWWICSLGHEWEATATMRCSRNHGCPFCAGRYAWPGFNDLASQSPYLASQWHPTKNGTLTPDEVTAKSDKKVWWLYRYDDPQTGKHYDFEWEASVLCRFRTPSVPYLREGNRGIEGMEKRNKKQKEIPKELNDEDFWKSVIVEQEEISIIDFSNDEFVADVLF